MPDTPGTNANDHSAWQLVLDRIGVVLKRLKRINLQFYRIRESLWQLGGGGSGVDKGTQMLLTFKYQELAQAGVILPFQEAPGPKPAGAGSG